MGAFDLLVMPSVADFSPLVCTEAMAAALPLVATAVGGVSEYVSHGETGLLVAPRDTGALTEAIVHLLADREARERFARAGRERVRAAFSAATQVPEIEAVFAEAAAARRPTRSLARSCSS